MSSLPLLVHAQNIFGFRNEIIFCLEPWRESAKFLGKDFLAIE